MGRPSKLTDRQWADIERRMVGGEAVRALAREYKIQPSTIRERLSARVEATKTAAASMAKAGELLDKLPISAQINARSLADRLRGISDNLAAAAELGAMTAHRLQALANSEVQKVDDARPLDSLEALKGVALLTKLANDSAETGLNLLAANKDRIKDQEAAAAKTLTDDELMRIAGQE